MINQVMNGVTEALPTQIDKQLPAMTQESIPVPPKKQLEIPEIHIPDVHIPFTHIPNYDHSNVEVIGCTYYHRDTKNTGNRNLILDDPGGVTSNCPYPSFYPLNYQADQLIITEEMPNLADEGEMPSSKPPKTEIPKDKKKDDDIVPPCPDKNDARIGTYTSEARTERIKIV